MRTRQGFHEAENEAEATTYEAETEATKFGHIGVEDLTSCLLLNCTCTFQFHDEIGGWPGVAV